MNRMHPLGADIPPIEQFETIFDEMLHPPKIRIQGNEACRHVGENCITIPEMARFERSESYYSMLFHELVHATGNEEPKAEMGASFSWIRIKDNNFKNSLSYFKGSVKDHQDDHIMVIYAS